MKNSIFRIFYFLIVIIPVIISCEREETEKDKILSRLFRPASFTATVTDNVIHFSWTPIGNATYLLEVSKDSLLFTNELQSIVVERNSYTLSDLWSQTRYSARVKAVSKNPEMGDSGYTKEVTVKTGTENIFYVVTDENISSNSVLLTWNKEKNVSHIVISASGISDSKINLSDSNITDGEILLTNLNSGVSYTFRIYLGEMLRGTTTVKTK